MSSRVMVERPDKSLLNLLMFVMYLDFVESTPGNEVWKVIGTQRPPLSDLHDSLWSGQSAR